MIHTHEAAEPNVEEVEEHAGEQERASLDQLSAADGGPGVVMKPGPDCPVG